MTPEEKELCGLLIINKPAGLTSHDVVQRVKRLFKARKVGHTGTLDPDATGVLVLCINAATKWAEALKDHDKSYRATIQLGSGTDTGDASGTVTSRGPVPTLASGPLDAILAHFRGPIIQQVPRYAAVKVQGRALYRWAREQRSVPLPKRQVTIHALELIDFTEDTVTVQVHCSTGTYIRSLAEDIGLGLGCPAHLARLQRTSVGPLTLERAIDLKSLAMELEHGQFRAEQRLLALEEALAEPYNGI